MENLKFIDCHTHLCDEIFDADLEAVIERAVQAGLNHALVVAEKKEEFNKIIAISNRFPGTCLPCFGVHPVQGQPPTDQRSVQLKDLEEAIPLIRQHQEDLICIGEVGLDFTPRFIKTEECKDIQREVLRQQVNLAKEFDLPVNVHSRSAGRPTIALLKECGAQRVLLHAFDGKASVAMEGVQLGYMFSIPPSIVRSGQQKLVERVPLDNLLLETDSPALGPVKQERNEPANIRVAVEYIAQVKKLPVEEVADVIWKNTLKLFPKITRFIK